MAHLRGVFIAPSTTNYRASHRRSKSHSEVPLPRAELCRSPLGRTAESLNWLAPPKETVTLEIRPIYNNRPKNNTSISPAFTSSGGDRSRVGRADGKCQTDKRLSLSEESKPKRKVPLFVQDSSGSVYDSFLPEKNKVDSQPRDREQQRPSGKSSHKIQTAQSDQHTPFLASVLLRQFPQSGITVVKTCYPQAQGTTLGQPSQERAPRENQGSEPEKEDRISFACCALESTDVLQHNNQYLQRLINKKEFQPEETLPTFQGESKKTKKISSPELLHTSEQSNELGKGRKSPPISLKEVSLLEDKSTGNLETGRLSRSDNKDNKKEKPLVSYQDFKREAWGRFARSKHRRHHSFGGLPLEYREKRLRESSSKDNTNTSVSLEIKKIREAQKLIDAAMATSEKSIKVGESKGLWDSKENDGGLVEKVETLEREVSEKTKENQELTQSLHASQTRVMSLETENRILENQVRMMEESNKDLYKNLHEIRSKLRIQESKVDELRIQKSESVRKLSQVLQSSLDRNTRFSFFLHQLEAEVTARETAQKKAKVDRDAALEKILKDEKRRERKSGSKESTAQSGKISSKEKEILRGELEQCLLESSPQEALERVMQVAEIGLAKALSVRLDSKDEEIAELQKKLDFAKEQVQALKNADVKTVEMETKIEERIRSKRKAIGDEVNELTQELSSAEMMKKEQEFKLDNVRKFSNADRIENLQAMRRVSRDEIADIQSAIRTMESKSQVDNDLSEQEKEILSLNQRISKTMEEKAELSEELLLSQTNLQSLEKRCNEKQTETLQLYKELDLKRQEIGEMEQRLQVALDDMTNMMIKLDTANAELEVKDKKLREMRHSKDNAEESEADSGVGEEYKFSPRGGTPRKTSESENDEALKAMKEELVQTLLALESAQVERQEALRQNEELAGELDKREQEISTLIMEIEREKKPTEANTSPKPVLVSELWSSVQEATQTKEEKEQTHKALEQELIVKQREILNLKTALAKQQKENEEQSKIADNYKAELAHMKEIKQKADSAPQVFEKCENRDKGTEMAADGSAALRKEVKTQIEDIEDLQEEVQKLQQVLANEMETSRNHKEQVAKLKDSLRIAREAKDCTFKRNKELAEQLQRKDAKIHNLTATMEKNKKSTENENWGKMVDELRAAVEESQNQCKFFETRIQDLRNDLSEKDRTIIELQAQMDGLATAIPSDSSTPKREKKVIKKENEEGESLSLTGLQDEIRILKVQVTLRDKSIEEKISEVYKKDKTIKKLQHEKEIELRALAETIEKLQDESEKLRTENALLENEASDTMDGCALRDENALLRKELNEMSYSLAVTRAECGDLREELTHMENKSEQVHDSLAHAQSLKDDLESQVDDLNFQKSSLEKENDLLRKKMEIVEEEMKLTAIENKPLDAVDAKPLSEENEALKAQISQITVELALNREELLGAKQELEKTRDKCASLQDQISDMEQKKDDLENQVTGLSSQRNTQEKELGLLKKRMEYTEEEIRRTEQDLSRKAEQIKQKESELRRLFAESSSDSRIRENMESRLRNERETQEQAIRVKEEVIEQLTVKNSELQSEISKIKMVSTESRYEQRRLDRELTEMRDRFRDAERKYGTLKSEKGKIEDELKDTKKRLTQYQTELNEARTEIRQKDDVIRKLNYKNAELQTLLSEKNDALKREEKLRMENMKALDVMKMKLERVEGDDKKQKDRLFSLKSACSEANEAYEIVKKQNLALKTDLEELKKSFADKNMEVENNRREKERLEEQILNASRTIDDIRKYSNRDESMSPDSALGISLESLGDLSSGPNSPNSDVSDQLFDEGDLKFSAEHDQKGLLCKMPTMIENFRAVVRDNEAMKIKLLELVSYRQKSDNQLQHYTSLSDNLQKDIKGKDMFLEELQGKSRMLEEELHEAKSKLLDVEKNYAAAASEADLMKTTLQVREETVDELREKVELLEEKEKALELYSKSIAEKYEHESQEKKKIVEISETLESKNRKQQELLESLEKKLSEFSEKEERMASKIQLPVNESDISSTDVAMETLEGKLDMIVRHSEELSNSLSAVQSECGNLQAENERLLREMVERDVYDELVAKVHEQELSFQARESEFSERVSSLEEQIGALERENREKEESINCWVEREEELLDEMRAVRQQFAPLETRNELLKADIEALKESNRGMEESRTKIESEIKSTKAKMCEMEITNEAYKEENDRLRSEIIALSEEKCEVECKVSEAERQEVKLHEVIKHERAQRSELEAEHNTVLSRCESLQNDLVKAKESISSLEQEQEKTQRVKDDMETRLLELANANSSFNDELMVARRDLGELEDRYKEAVQEEEELRQKLSKSSMENSKLNTAYEQSQRRKETAEKDLVEANAKNEDLEAAVEKARMEKAGVLKEISAKEEQIQRMEAKMSDLEEEKQKFTNELYLSTRKVLSLQLNLESLRNEVSQLGKELRRLIQDSLGREPRDEAEEKSIEADIEKNLIESEVVVMALRNSIKTTEKSLDLIRPEAKVTEHEYNNCQRDIDCMHREFAFLKDHLTNFKQSCQKQSDEIRRIKEDLKSKESLLQETKEELEALKEENSENKETILHLQGKCTDLETLFAEYESKAETTHEELVQANQTIAALEGNVAKLEQKKATLEKERLVYQEKIKNLEAGVRTAKDETRMDKKRIATLEVEYAEKQGMARDLEKMDDNLTELRLKYDDLVKEREEVKSDLATTREELRQEQIELKNARKEGENMKKHVMAEKDARSKVEQELHESNEQMKTQKRNIQELQRNVSKLEEENAVLEEKVKLLDEASSNLKNQTEVQTVELKRLRDSLTDAKNQLTTSNNNYEGSERERKRLMEELIHSEEQVKKLQDTCNELLHEKSVASDKVLALNDTLEATVLSSEQMANSLKQELMTTNKDLAITRSTLERSQKREEELQEDIKQMEDKIAIIEEKKQEMVEKFWKSQNDLSEAESTIDSLRSENKDLKNKCALITQRAERLEETVQLEREESEKTIGNWNDKMMELKSQFTRTSDERDDLKAKLEETEETLASTKENLEETSTKLSETEKLRSSEVSERDSSIEELRTNNENLRGDLKRTKESFREACIENSDLREKLSVTEEKLERVDAKLQELENDNVDALAEAQAKLNVVNRMRASNSGERFAELQSSTFLASSDDEDYHDRVDAVPSLPAPTVQEAIASFHRACLNSFNDNRALQDSLSAAKQEIERLEETINKDRNDMAELKRYLVESEKKKTKLEEEVKRVRRRLENLKQKAIELERQKDDELCEVKGDKVSLEKEQWELREAIEELRATLKGVEEERDRYENELDDSRKQYLDAKNEIKRTQQQLDDIQDKMLDMRKRVFELETNEKCMQQLLQEREKELQVRQNKISELQTLYDTCNQKKTELYTQAAKAEDKVGQLENIRKENVTEQATLKDEIRSLNGRITDQERTLARTEKELEEAKERGNELEIQRGSLQASNEILKHQVEVTRGEIKALKESFEKSTEDNMNISKVLNDRTTEKENLETERKCLLQEKNRTQDLLDKSEQELKAAEENLVKSFQENESLKRQMLKVQSTSCADSVKLQADIGKLKTELQSTKKDLSDKIKEYNDLFAKNKVTEKENEFLKKELGNTHNREAELKLDFTSTNSKLQSYVLERECWEREVKTVLAEIEHQKNSNSAKEQRLERLRKRYEQEIGFLSQRVTALERELRVVQEASEQQRHADEIAAKLALEAKDMEIDNLRMRLQATKMTANDRSSVVDQMKNQLDERSQQINELMEQIKILKDSYHLELASVQADLKCSQMENLLKIRRDMGNDNSFTASQDTVSDLLEAIKASRKESERLRKLLGKKMMEMKSLKRHILSERTSPRPITSKSYSIYGRDKLGDISVD
ncbi:centrosomal protein of 290 kDa [Nematostella vectensis]|uniref:centrosomal protein of 290 kDa n=1 Tax=Nematostella vectensis TaxID=45351 RepID=UPI002076D955|nr:centrosomal protein of 290 kDa [Nematostella vectensis]XP_032232002.2 centrosomal protein of 290 kDa [Nematostella vectensis]